MRVLLDECLPRRLARELVGHEVRTVPEMGWAGTKDGPLMVLVEGRFEAFVTSDRNLRYQQNLAGRSIGVVVLVARTNKLADLLPLVAGTRDALTRLTPGQVIEVTAP